MDEIISKFAEQAAVIKAAPYPFILAVALVIGVIWVIVNYFYSNTLSSKNAQLELADRQIADYKQKLGGASPDEAKMRIDALEKRLAQMEPRRLTKEQQTIMSSRLLPLPKASIRIVHDGACIDCNQYAADFNAAFSAAGWPVMAAMGLGIGPQSPKGVTLVVYDTGNPAAENALTKALEAAVVLFDVVRQIERNEYPDRPPTGMPSLLITARASF
jgi:hypothetical protein